MRLTLALGLLALACGSTSRSSSRCRNTVEPVPPEGVGRVSPSDPDQREARANGLSQLRVVVNVCVNYDGTVNRTTLLESSGLPCYDEKVLATVERATFQEFTRDPNQCGKVTVKYDIAAAPTP